MPISPVVDAEFQIPAHGRHVALVRRGIRFLAEGAGFTQSECEDIEVAVGEAVTNAVYHGCRSDSSRRVLIHCSLSDDRLTVEVEDDGKDACLPIPEPNRDMTDEHGRGWYLVHVLMNEVTSKCTDRGLLVQMVKIHKPERSSKNTGQALRFSSAS